MPGAGSSGSTCFFVLSGYLITRVLLDEHARTGRVDVGRFYSRRVRRLLPAALVTVVVTAAATLIVDARLTRTGYVGDARSALLYVSNWHFLDRATDYFAPDVAASPFLHFWSLSLEEQFYAAFPIVVIGLLALRRRSTGWPVVIGGVAVLAAASLGWQLWWAHRGPLHAYYATDAPGVSTAGRGGARRGVEHPTDVTREPQSTGPRRGRCSALLPSGCWSSSPPTSSTSRRRREASSPAGRPWPCSRPWNTAGRDRWRGGCAVGPLVDLGRISYGTYLWHWPILVLVARMIELPALSRFLLAATGATALAALSALLLEFPVRSSPLLTRWPRSIVVVGVAISVLAATSVVGPILRNDRRPDVSSGVVANPGVVAPGARVAVPTAEELDVIAADRTARYSCLDGVPDDCIRHVATDPIGLRIHIVGDSNAAMLVPMLEELATEHDFTLSASTIVGCPWQEGLGWDVTDQVLIGQLRARTSIQR